MTSRIRRTLAVLLAVTGLGLAALALWIAVPLPPGLAAPAPVPALTLEDRDGVPLRTTRAADGSRGGWIPLAELDPKLPQAFVAMEDRGFYSHHGVELRALARALRDNLRARHVVSGGSTITMQLARLVRSSPRTLGGKIAQILWALRLDAHLDKPVILEQYLNRVPLGQGTVGVSPPPRRISTGRRVS